MAEFNAEVRIELKPGILDAEGKTTLKALNLLGFKEVHGVQSIKLFKIDLNANSKEEAEQKVQGMCKRLLANPVINNYTIEIEE